MIADTRRLHLCHVRGGRSAAQGVSALEVVFMPTIRPDLASGLLGMVTPPTFVPGLVGLVDLRAFNKSLVGDRGTLEVGTHVANQGNRLEKWFAFVEPDRLVGNHD